MDIILIVYHLLLSELSACIKFNVHLPVEILSRSWTVGPVLDNHAATFYHQFLTYFIELVPHN